MPPIWDPELRQCFWIQFVIRSRTLGENCISAHGCPGADGCVHTHIQWSMFGIVATVKSHREVGVRSFTEVSHKRPEVRRGVKLAVASEHFQNGHVAGAVNLPHGRIVERNLADYPMDTLFVVYCAGPHCNGADRAAVRLARLGRPVKKMIGGVEGWRDDGFALSVD